MNTARFVRAACFCGIAAMGLATSACSRGDQSPPVAETQTKTPVQATNQVMTVTGCLRAGEAEGVFVLTAEGAQPATYHLVGRADALRDHIGRRIEVNGTVRAQQQIASRAAAPADQKAAGTTGTPTIETTSQLTIKEFDVSTVRSLGDRCER